MDTWPNYYPKISLSAFKATYKKLLLIIFFLIVNYEIVYDSKQIYSES